MKPISSLNFPCRDVVSEHIRWALQSSDASSRWKLLEYTALLGRKNILTNPHLHGSCQWVVVSLIHRWGKLGLRDNPLYLPKVKYWGSEGGRGAWHTPPPVVSLQVGPSGIGHAGGVSYVFSGPHAPIGVGAQACGQALARPPAAFPPNLDKCPSSFLWCVGEESVLRQGCRRETSRAVVGPKGVSLDAGGPMSLAVLWCWARHLWG